MKKIILFLGITLFLVSCKSTSSTKDKDVLEEARVAILKAEAVDARLYDVEDMSLADDFYAKAEASKEKEQSFKTNAISSKKSADDAYEKSLPSFKEQIKLDLDDIIAKLDKVDFSRYNKKAYTKTKNEVDKAKDLVDANNFDAFKVREEYSRLLAKGRNLRKILSTNKKMVSEEKEFYIESKNKIVVNANSDDLKMMNDFYDSGVKNEADYNLEAAYQDYQLAKMISRSLSEVSANPENMGDIDAFLRRVQAEIESASELFVEDENGDLVNPEPYSGEAFLASNPLVIIDTSSSVSDKITLDKSALKPLKKYDESESTYPEDGVDMSKEKSEKDKTEATKSGDETVALFDKNLTLVAGDTSSLSLYKKAIELWEAGVNSRNEQNFAEAQDYFEQAEEYINEFKRGSVRQFYTVKLRPSARDCLWRISAMKDVYGNANLWPIIWQRNQKKITNPDMIFPGQKLMIPPLVNEKTLNEKPVQTLQSETVSETTTNTSSETTNSLPNNANKATSQTTAIDSSSEDKTTTEVESTTEVDSKAPDTSTTIDATVPVLD